MPRKTKSTGNCGSGLQPAKVRKTHYPAPPERLIHPDHPANPLDGIVLNTDALVPFKLVYTDDPHGIFLYQGLPRFTWETASPPSTPSTPNTATTLATSHVVHHVSRGPLRHDVAVTQQTASRPTRLADLRIVGQACHVTRGGPAVVRIVGAGSSPRRFVRSTPSTLSITPRRRLLTLPD